MLFSSFAFIFAFLPIVWGIFHFLKSARFARFCDKINSRFCENDARFHANIDSYKIAKIFLVCASLFFYAFWKLAYLPILLTSIIINYALAKAILQYSKKKFLRIGGGESLK